MLDGLSESSHSQCNVSGMLMVAPSTKISVATRGRFKSDKNPTRENFWPKTVENKNKQRFQVENFDHLTVSCF